MTGTNRDQLPPGLPGPLKRSFMEAIAECPYGVSEIAIYHQGIFGQLEDAAMEDLLAYGYRRNGNCIYNMHCPGCQACVPIRVRPERFRLNRNQRRVWKKNQDVAVEIGPLTVTREKLLLLQRFLSIRFPAGRSNAESYYSGFFITSLCRCFEIRYRVDDQLLGVAIVDGGLSWLNAVYFFFDPEQGWRSPGTLNILTLVHLCQKQKIDLLYLGYWIRGHTGMGYKETFRPHELLLDGFWREQS